MGWASFFIEKLKKGETVSFRPRGNSMVPRINSGELCTVKPVVNPEDITIGDIVLCRVGGFEYLHLICSTESDRYVISNNKGRINGKISINNIFGKLIKIEL